MNIYYKSLQMPEDFIQAVETIMHYCQHEDCDEDCDRCPYPLATIRCGDTEESGYVKREHVVEIIDEQIVKYNNKTNRLEITEKAIDALKISAPVIAMTQEEFNDYIQTLNQVMNWLEQEPKTGHWIENAD